MERIEQHDVPEALAERIRAKGGLNPHGEPNFRIIWGWKRLAWHGGKFYDRDDSGNCIREVVELRQTPKYLPPNRWYFEMWVPAEYFAADEADWKVKTLDIIDGVPIETLGPFPRNGDYEAVSVLQTPLAGECAKNMVCSCGNCLQFAPLTATVVDALMAAIHASRHIPHAMKMAASRARREHQDRVAAEERKDIVTDLQRPFGQRPYIVVPGQN